MRLRVGGAGLLLLLAASACASRGEAGSPDVMKVAAVAGTVQVRAGQAGSWEPLAEGRSLSAGQQVRTLDGGTVRFAGDRGSAFEMASRSEARVLSGRALSIVRGSALVTARGPVALDSQGVSARSERGVFRMDRALSVRVGVYEGGAKVGLRLASLDVPRLREVVVAGATLPRSVHPLAIREDDRWDRRYLTDAIDLDRELGNLSRGFDAQYGAQASSAALFTRFIVLGQTAFIDPFLSGARSSDILVGLVMASSISARPGGSLPDTFRSLMDARLDGATWGLIAVERGVNPAQLVARLVATLGGPPSQPVPPAGGGGPGGGGPGGPGGGGPGGPGGGGGPGGPGGGSPGPTSPGSPSPGPTGDETPAPVPTETALPTPTPTPVPSPTCDPITGAIDPRCQGDNGLPGLPGAKPGRSGGASAGIAGGLVAGVLGIL